MKLKIKGLKKEMSTTGTGASFAAGVGAQYATPKAFKKRKEEIGEPFTKPNPSVPNRKSKFMDYKQIFEDAMEELKFNPITDFTDSQAWAGDNTGYDMDTQDAASVLELAKYAGGKWKVGDTDISKGIKYTVTDVDPETGGLSWDVESVPAFDSVYKEFDELRKAIAVLDRKTDDEIVDDIAGKIKAEFNRYRTHIRKNYPDEYKRFQTAENIDPKSQAKHKGKSAPFGSAYEPVTKENIDKVAGGIPYKIENGNAIISMPLPDDTKERIIKRAKANGYLAKPNMGGGVTIFKESQLNEARYSQFKTETKLRTPTEQIHRAVREIRRKIDEIVKVVGHTERMKSELKGSNEGMSYLKRTRNAINTISEKLQELNNRIKGLTE
jgi:hypothetical protein